MAQANNRTARHFGEAAALSMFDTVAAALADLER